MASSRASTPSTDARARARRMQEEQQRRDRRRRSLWIWGAVLAAALAAALVVALVANQGRDAAAEAGPLPAVANTEGGVALTSTTALADGGEDVGEVKAADVQVPEGAGGQPESVPGAEAPGDGEPHHVVVYADFNCVHCAEFEMSNAEQLNTWLDEGKATVEYRIVDFLSTPGNQNYSARAANAAYCVAEQKPEAYNAFVEGLFAAYQQHGGKGISDDELVDRAEELGADISSCVKDDAYRPAVAYATAKAKAAGVGGTPTVLMDGKNWAIDGAEDSFGDWASAKIEG